MLGLKWTYAGTSIEAEVSKITSGTALNELLKASREMGLRKQETEVPCVVTGHNARIFLRRKAS
jgi:hypothetical protein